MKKTVTVNLAGLVFTIDDDAYSRLEAYLESIEAKFAGDPESNEIMRDIELRIGELFNERKQGMHASVNLSDVEYVIATMGDPEAFSEDSEEDTADSSQKQSTYNRKKYRRMYRDPDHRVIGGVCSGLGAYLGVDPVIIRVIFLVAFFFFGAGVIIYLVLWLVMPEAITTSQKLEMRGEPVTVDSISDFVKQEFNHIKNSMKFGKNRK